MAGVGMRLVFFDILGKRYAVYESLGISKWGYWIEVFASELDAPPLFDHPAGEGGRAHLPLVEPIHFGFRPNAEFGCVTNHPAT